MSQQRRKSVKRKKEKQNVGGPPLPTQLTKEKAKEKGRLVALDLTPISSEVA